MQISFTFPKVSGTVWQRTVKVLQEKPWKHIFFQIALYGALPVFVLSHVYVTISGISVTGSGLSFFLVIYFLSLIVAILGFILFMGTREMVLNAYLKDLAQLNGFLLEKYPLLFPSKSRLIERGRRKGMSVSFRDRIYGKKEQIDVEFIHFSFSYQVGKNTKTEQYLILSFDFHKPIPDIILSQGNSFDTESWQRSLRLEGDFHKHYSVYVPEEHEIEALQILTPEIMQLCVDKDFNGSIETAGNKLFVYIQQSTQEADAVIKLFTFGARLASALYPRIQNLKYIPYEHE